MLVVYKPDTGQTAQAHLRWLKSICTTKKIVTKWCATSGDFATDKEKIRLLAKQHSKVVAVGGDGTLNLVVNSIVDLECQLALLPSGTGNDFARQFNYQVAQWRDAVFSPKYTRVDLGRVNTRYFINMLGVGFNAQVVENMQHHKNKTKLSYMYTGLKSIFSYRNISVNTLNNVGTSQHVMMTLICNGQYFASGLKSAPSADYNDGLLTALEFTAGNLWQRLLTFVLMFFAKHEGLNQVTVSNKNEFTLATPGLLIEADGDIIGHTPCTVSCYAGKVKLSLPSKKP